MNHFMVSNNQKTMEQGDDIIAILKSISCCYKAKTTQLFNPKFSEIGLFSLHNCFVRLLNVII